MRSMLQTDLMFLSATSVEASWDMPMKVLSHPGPGNSNCCVVARFLEDVSPLIQEASSVLTNWRGVAGL